MSRFRRLLRWTLITFLILALAGAVGLGVLYYTVSSKVPDVQALRSVELQEPLYIYASDGRLMGLYGEIRRYPVQIDQVPARVKQAFIAATDKLQAAVQSKDKAQVGTAYEAVHDSCKSCHKQFKAR